MGRVGDTGHQPGNEIQRLERMTAGGRSSCLVGGVGHFTVFASAGMILQALQRDGIARAVTGQAQMARCVVLVEPDRIVDAEAGVQPTQHGLGHLGLEQLAIDEQLE